MGKCGAFLRISGYILIATAASLYYFHLECLQEQKEKAKSESFDTFNPEITDVADVPLPFVEEGGEIDVGVTFMLLQSAPCAVCKMLEFLSMQDNAFDKKPDPKSLRNITIKDARKSSPGDFHDTGFTLIELDEAPTIKDWRTNTLRDPDAEISNFFTQMEPYIKQLYPNVKKMKWTNNVVRGGNVFGDQPKAAHAPHLDYHQSKEKRIEFHKEYPAMPTWITNFTEPNVLMGHFDDDDNKLGVLLGLWKPIHPEFVCDWPLAIMDARTFKPEHQLEGRVHVNFGVFTYHNLGGGIAHSPEQRWYYYPFQSTSEVLIFHQYSEGKWLANPHTSFFNRNCPENTQPRQSVEMRLGLYF